jgi:hypothetical protein
MLEILLMWFTAKHMREESSRKGRPTGVQWLVLLIPVAGIAVAVITGIGAGVFAVVTGNRDLPLAYLMYPAYFVAEIGLAFGLRRWVDSQTSLRSDDFGFADAGGFGPPPAKSSMLEPVGPSVPPEPASAQAGAVPPAPAPPADAFAPRPRPAPVRVAPPANVLRPGGRAKAGFCSGCGKHVWLNPDDSCTNGHARSAIRGVYEAATGAPEPARP